MANLGKLAFIGAGNMASSMISGLVSASSAQDIIVADPDTAQLRSLAAKFGVNSAASNSEAVATADAVVLAVKPNIVQAVCAGIAKDIQHQPWIVSVSAGVQTPSILRWLETDVAIIRCMPNTPAYLNLGATALYANERCSADQRALAEQLLSAIGMTTWVNSEEQIDTVTALSGSGPAYFFHLIECITQTAVDMGLDKDVAENLAIETAFGAAAMAKERTSSPAQLRQNVTSRGGTTAAALAVFAESGFADTVASAMAAAKTRAQELGEELGA